MYSKLRKFNSPEIQSAYLALLSNRSIISYVRTFLLDIRHDVKGPLDLRTVIGQDIPVKAIDVEFYQKQMNDLVDSLPCVQNGCATISITRKVEATKIFGWEQDRVTVFNVHWELTDHGNLILDSLLTMSPTNIMFDRQTYQLDIPETLRLLSIAMQNDQIILSELIGDIDTIEDDRLLDIKRLAVMERLARSVNPDNPEILQR